MANDFLRVFGYDETPVLYIGEGPIYYHIHLDGRFIVSDYQIEAKDAYMLNLTNHAVARSLWNGYRPQAYVYRSRHLESCLNVQCTVFPTLEA